ncbi:MAG TPA: glycosyltransferase [Gemmatimonadaceae bacterium]|nr:glycosyltransferase [Gemmatimonadaceae bacterium]
MVSSEASHPFVTVVIPVRNGEATLGDCLAAIVAMDYPPDRREIVVVDNGSTDRTPEIVRRFGLRYIREERRGAVNARNRAIAETEGEMLAFVDADCMVTKRWLRELMDALADDTNAAAAGELVAYPPRTDAERYMARRKPLWQQWASARRAPWFLIGNCAIRRSVFDQIGVLDPAFAVVGCEDIELSRRFFDAGLELRYCPRALAFHRHRATARSLFRQQLRNGRGQSLVQYRYSSTLPWGWREELAAWLDLAGAAWRLTSTLTRRMAGGVGREDVSHVYHDLVLKVGQRLGFTLGWLRWRLTAARRTGLRARLPLTRANEPLAPSIDGS